MSKQMQTKTAAPLAMPPEMAGWGADVKVGKDILLAKILPMQPSSEFVTDGKAQIGEFRDSLSGSKMGSIAEPMEFLPFHAEKMWDIMEDDGSGQYKWKQSFPLIEDPLHKDFNDNLEWQGMENGVAIKRIRRFNFYVMIPSEIALGTGVPYVLSFKSTSLKEGKKVLNQMYLRNTRAQLPPPGYLFKLSGTKRKNDKGTFIVPTVELARKSEQAEMLECFNWYKLIMAGQVKVDESDVSAVETDDLEVESFSNADSGVGAF
jgi:hypothetical protein